MSVSYLSVDTGINSIYLILTSVLFPFRPDGDKERTSLIMSLFQLRPWNFFVPFRPNGGSLSLASLRESKQRKRSFCEPQAKLQGDPSLRALRVPVRKVIFASQKLTLSTRRRKLAICVVKTKFLRAAGEAKLLKHSAS